MIIPDINLLVYTYNADAPAHSPAKRWWENVLSGSEIVGLPWAVICGFIRLMTNTRVLLTPLTPEEAVDYVRTWFSVAHVRAVSPGPQHIDILGNILGSVGAAGPLTTDAHIAAIAIEYTAVLHTNNAAFDRFPGVRRVNPLV